MPGVLKANFYTNDRVLLIESTFSSLTYLQEGYLPQALQSELTYEVSIYCFFQQLLFGKILKRH